MARPTTTEYGWTMPEPDADIGQWDNVLNSCIEAIDSDLAAVQAIAEASLQEGDDIAAHTVDSYAVFQNFNLGSATSGEQVHNVALAGPFVKVTFNGSGSLNLLSSSMPDNSAILLVVQIVRTSPFITNISLQLDSSTVISNVFTSVVGTVFGRLYLLRKASGTATLEALTDL